MADQSQQLQAILIQQQQQQMRVMQQQQQQQQQLQQRQQRQQLQQLHQLQQQQQLQHQQQLQQQQQLQHQQQLHQLQKLHQIQQRQIKELFDGISWSQQQSEQPLSSVPASLPTKQSQEEAAWQQQPPPAGQDPSMTPSVQVPDSRMPPQKQFIQSQNSIPPQVLEVSYPEIIHLRNHRPDLANRTDVQLRAIIMNAKRNGWIRQKHAQTQAQAQPQTQIQAQADSLPPKPEARVPIYKATITELAHPSQMKPATATILNEDAAIQRIKKCLSRANHPGTPELEAKAALHMASRLMAQHNVTQAEVLANEPRSSQLQFAGQSIVAIRRSDGDRHKIVRIQGYIDYLVDAIRTFFNCKHYSERVYGAVNFTFYGLADNTFAAATAFEMVYNLMTTWALKYPGRDRTSYLLGICETLKKTAEKEAIDEVERAKEAEKDATMAQPPLEETQRQVNMDRTWPTNDTAEVNLSPESPETIPLAGFTHGVSVESSHDDRNAAATVHSEAAAVGDGDGDENDEGVDGFIEPDFHTETSSRIDPSMDIDEEIHRLASITKHPPEQPNAGFVTSSRPSNWGQDSTVKPHRESSNSVYTKHHTQGSNGESAPIPPLNNEGTWKSHMQLVVFRKTAENIADDYLKSRGIKLVSEKSRSRRVHNMTAYRQGSQDSKKIDVRRRMIS